MTKSASVTPSRRARVGTQRCLVATALFALVLVAALPAWAHDSASEHDTDPTVVSTESVNAEATGKVLILDDTVTGGVSSVEAEQAVAQGFGVDVVSAVTWGAMSAADFAAYEAIILGDDNCTSASS